jgi:hypothetical protein
MTTQVSHSVRKGTVEKKRDDFWDAQDHYNPRFKREMSLVHNY